MKIKAKDLNVVMTCGACPEQYDVFYDGIMVGYLRLRHGGFRADFGQCGGPLVYYSVTEGDGVFTDEERPGHMKAALKAIAKRLNSDRAYLESRRS